MRAARIEHVIIVGGPAAVSQQAQDQLSAQATVARVAELSRWETAAEISAHLRRLAVESGVCPAKSTRHIGLASGDAPADAAALTPLLAARCGEMLFGGAGLGSPLPQWTLSRVRQIRWQNDTYLIVAGGPFAVSRAAADRAANPF